MRVHAFVYWVMIRRLPRFSAVRRVQST
jgi:hypothetical protein